MTTPSVSRREWIWAAALGLIAFSVRAWPFVADGTAWGHWTGYDDGVYFTASALMTQGVWPYRDFAFVHPPGFLLALAPLTAWTSGVSPETLFAASRWAMAFLGGLNTVGILALARQGGGLCAGLFAGLVYALHPEAVEQERSPYLEPLLNSFCLLSALSWFAPSTPARTRVSAFALGFAVTIKVWAVAWVLPLWVSTRAEFRQRLVPWSVASALTAVLAVAPFAWMSGREFLKQVFWFQLVRPHDGTAKAGDRLWAFIESHPGSGGIALAACVFFGLIWLWQRPTSPHERFAVTCFLALAALFLSGKSYWTSYNGHLALMEALLAGLGVARIAGLGSNARKALAPLAVLCVWPSWKALEASFKATDSELLAAVSALKADVPGGACVFAMEPAHVLATGRLPDHCQNRPWVDGYAEQLLRAFESPGPRPANIQEAFMRESSQAVLRAAFADCDVLLLGWRGAWQMSPDTRQAVAQTFVRLHEGGVEVWRRKGIAPK
ncbi:MAG: hypothetical protein ACKVPX_01950 [Myxococcaceae bacterium]